jgi:hypothetical protein
MKNKQSTLDQYLEAEEDQRLQLFVFHRELRGEFEKIEREEMEAAEAGDSHEERKSGPRQWAAHCWTWITMKDRKVISQG